MARFTQAQKEERRQQILDAALRCFSRDGFHNTTTGDIVREAGVSQGALYLYFTTKDEIIDALGDDRRQGEALLTALAEAEPDPAEGLALLIELHGRSLTDPDLIDARRVGIQGWAEALRNATVRQGVRQGVTGVRREIVRLIERGQAAGEFRADADPEAAARVLIAVFQGLALQTCLGEAIDLAAVGVLIRQMIRGALYARS